MKVLVVRQIAENGRDIEIVMIVRLEGALSMVSPIVTIEGKAPFASGNPYSVYGDEVAKFAGCNKFDCSISVAECVSGRLPEWEGDSDDSDASSD